MTSTAAVPRLTADGLIAVATRNDLHATQRLITDWVALGLIDRPYHPARGQGLGSVKGTWPLKQAELFIDLLMLRQRPERPIKHIAALTNLPVLGWLWAGEDPDVPVRQVRRALATWCGRHRSRTSTPYARARKIAREIVKQVDNPHASASERNALRDLIAVGIRDQTFDLAKVRVAVKRVFDPHEVGRVLGPPAASVTAASYVRMLEAQATVFMHLETFSDQEYEDARIIYRQSRREYVTLYPALEADPQRGRLHFEEPTFVNLLNDACKDLLLLLGMGRLAPGRRAELATEARQAVSS